MKSNKIFTALFLATVMAISVLAGNVRVPAAVLPASIVAEGNFHGEGGAPWRLDSDGIVTVGGGTATATWEFWLPEQNRREVREITFTEPVIASGHMNSFFANLPNMERIKGLGYLDTGAVTNMANMFHGAESLVELDVSNWDTGAVVGMGSMFLGALSLTELDVSNWDTGAVTDMSNMFSSFIRVSVTSSSLAKLDVSGWDTSSVTNMSGMFRGATSLVELDVSNWDTSSVTNMSWLFRDTSSLAKLDVSNWDTSAAVSMHQMFRLAESITELDLSNWDTTMVANNANSLFNNMGMILDGTPSLQEVTFGRNFVAVGHNGLGFPGPGLADGTPGLWTVFWRNQRTTQVLSSGDLWEFLGTARDHVDTWERVIPTPSPTPPPVPTPTPGTTPTPPPTPFPTPTPAPSSPGDLTGDDEINQADVVLLRQILVGGKTLPPDANADLNNDGTVNILDLTMLRLYLAGRIAEL